MLFMANCKWGSQTLKTIWWHVVIVITVVIASSLDVVVVVVVVFFLPLLIKNNVKLLTVMATWGKMCGKLSGKIV